MTRIITDLQGYMTPQEIARVLEHTMNKTEYLFLYMLFHTGRRTTELLRLKVKDINFERGLIRWNILKKGKDYQALKPIDSTLLKALSAYISENEIEPDHYVFRSPVNKGQHLTRQWAFQMMRRAAEKAGIFYVGETPPHPHHLRHSFAINYLTKSTRATALVQLKRLLEHSFLKTTEDYLQFSQQDVKRDLEEVFKKTPEVVPYIDEEQKDKDKIIKIEEDEE